MGIKRLELKFNPSRFWQSCWWVLGWSAWPTATFAQMPIFFPPALPNQSPSSPTVPVVGAETYFEGYPYENVTFPNRLSPNSQFLIWVLNEGTGTLERTRRVVRDAFPLSGRNIIQAGTFRSGENALSQTRELERQGLRVQIIEQDGNGQRVVYSSGSGVGQLPNVPIQPPRPRPPVVSRYCQDERVQTVQGLTPRAYIVVIPSEEDRVTQLCAEVARIVGFNGDILIRNQPIGLHIAVGSFSNLEEARSWENKLRNQGFSNARIVYHR